MKGSAAATLALVILALSACAPVQERSESADAGAAAPEPAEDDAATAPEAAPRAEPVPPPPASPAEPEPTETKADHEASAAQPAEPDAAAEPATPATPEPEPAAAATTTPETSGQDSAPTTPPAPRKVDLDGQIRLVGGDADVDEAVVYYVAHSTGGPAADASASGPAEIVTRDKMLSPTVLAVSRGTEVRFPNDDPILHNLFSVSSNNDFDLGVYGPGESPSVRFEHPGAVNIYCNVHHNMHAHVLVVDTPWHTRAATDGRFTLTALPAGDGELRIWHRQSEAWSRSIELPVDKPIEVSLEVTKPRLPPHRDKTGQPYNRRDRDPYR